ncbi:hypothetical protein [Hymenobacter properus]|uniref:Uncharacterized protein n=1 Tax=Hymenobacter properus TaxID=2791026 RepID=A0A931FNS4_9BACT|nr:hypothetical protein [Hymenobacter properus]MBF9144466.1 hypothetical protein [Hymenobacter properus]MBR7723284.1 hypothetical protein [Microvirga sp. SRT04]
MLSAYSWGQFGLFVLVVVVLYYLVVGLLYYRVELTALLTPGKKMAGAQLAGVGGSAAAPPLLVRPTSAFVKATPGVTEVREDADDAERTEAGADQNLPAAAEPLVSGVLPDSTGTATGHDESTSDTAPMEATAAAGDEAQVQDENRTEEADQADEHLAALVRRESHNPLPDSMAADAQVEGALEPETVQLPLVADGYEPLASFEEPVASRLDIAPVDPPRLVAAASVAEYLTLLQAGQQPAPPVELAGTTLAEQMAQQMALNHAELDDLFGPDDE